MSVPALRFPEFEGEWEEKRLDSLGRFKSGAGFPEIEQGGTVGTPFFKVSDMNLRGNENTLMHANHYVSDEQIERLRYKPILKQSVVFAKVGAAVFLERKRLAQDFLIDNNMMAFTPNSAISINYSIVLFRNTRLSKYAQVGALPSYNASDLASIKVKAPSLPEQKKIAAFLGVVDDKLAALTSKRDLLSDYKRGLMQKLFSQELRFTKPNGQPFPDWEAKKADALFRSVSNKNHSGELPILAITQEHGAILRDDIDIDIKATANSVASYKIVEKGDFIISLRSFQGGIEYSSVMGICSPAYTILKPNLPIIDGFYQQYMKKEDFITRLSATVVGIRDGKQISYSAFSTMKLVYPHPDEQQKIADALSALDDKILAVGHQITKLQDFKKGLLQQMFV